MSKCQAISVSKRAKCDGQHVIRAAGPVQAHCASCHNATCDDQTIVTAHVHNLHVHEISDH